MYNIFDIIIIICLYTYSLIHDLYDMFVYCLFYCQLRIKKGLPIQGASTVAAFGVDIDATAAVGHGCSGQKSCLISDGCASEKPNRGMVLHHKYPRTKGLQKAFIIQC